MRVMKISYWFALIGAIIMIASEIILGAINAFLFFSFSIGAIYSGEYGLELMPLTITISVVLGFIALRNILKSSEGSKKTFLIILIVGIIAAVGVFIPILPAKIMKLGVGITFTAPAVSLVNSLLYIEPYFILNYGLVGRLSFIESEAASAY